MGGNQQGELYVIADQALCNQEAANDAEPDSSSEDSGNGAGYHSEPQSYKPDSLAKKILMAPVYLVGAIALMIVCVIEFLINHPILAIIVALFVANILSSWIF